MKQDAGETQPHAARAIRALAWLVCALCIVAGAVALVLEPVNRSGPYKESVLYPGGLAIAVLFPLVGALIATRHPRNWIGWILIGMGLSEALAALTGPYAIYALFTHPGQPGGAFASWVDAWAWVPGFTLVALLLVLFPTGKLLSRRWGLIAWAAALGTGMEVLAFAVVAWPVRGPYLIIHRDAATVTTGAFANALDAVGGFFLIVSLLASVASIVVRYRRAGGVERQQIKWFAYAAALAALMLLASIELNPNGGYLNGDLFNLAVTLLQTLGYAGIAAAIGIAILRYRLYDIDILINRTLVYGSLSAVLAAVYFTCVIGTQAIIQAVTGTGSTNTPSVVIVVSTLLIAALFNPLRHRIQATIDRRFYRHKYDAARTLASFSATLRHDVDLGQLQQHLLSVVDETMQPAHASLWLRPDRREVTR